MTDRPHVRVQPGVQFGQPHVNWVATGVIAGMVWAGDTVATVAKEFGLTRAEVLVACWYEGTHGRPVNSFRRCWRQWAVDAGRAMWDARTADHEAIPDPPSKYTVANAGEQVSLAPQPSGSLPANDEEVGRGGA